MKPRSSLARRVRNVRSCVVAVACALTGWLAMPDTAEAKPRVGLGGGIGDPFGPSLKIFLAPQHALQFDLGWAPMHHGEGITHANYLFHFKPFVSNSVMDFGLYLGAGLGVAFWSNRHYYGYYYGHPGYYDGRYNCDRDPTPDDPDDCYFRRGGHGGGAAMIVRAPVGLFFHWMKVPLDTVIEGGWSPYVVPPWDPFHGDFSIKLRYYF
jgi:hypothetical protein